MTVAADRVSLHIRYEELLLMVSMIMRKKVANSSKKLTQLIKTRVLKPYSVMNKNGQNWPKWLENPIQGVPLPPPTQVYGIALKAFSLLIFFLNLFISNLAPGLNFQEKFLGPSWSL